MVYRFIELNLLVERKTLDPVDSCSVFSEILAYSTISPISVVSYYLYDFIVMYGIVYLLNEQRRKRNRKAGNRFTTVDSTRQ